MNSNSMQIYLYEKSPSVQCILSSWINYIIISTAIRDIKHHDNVHALFNLYVIFAFKYFMWTLCFFSQLVNTGVLTTRDIGSWWLSVPGAGIFMKNFSNGKVKHYFNLLIYLMIICTCTCSSKHHLSIFLCSVKYDCKIGSGVGSHYTFVPLLLLLIIIFVFIYN